MQIDIKGKINEKKLGYSNTLLPLFEAIVNSIQAIEEDRENFAQQHQETYSKIIKVGNSKLSEYIIHRKLVLDLFEKFLKTKAPEKAVHSLVFPLQTLSDEIGFEDHNLWMIDEKLSYHKYLASDKKFKKKTNRIRFK